MRQAVGYRKSSEQPFEFTNPHSRYRLMPFQRKPIGPSRIGLESTGAEG